MFKVPYTKDGDIRYTEVVKLFVLISLLFGLFSRFTTNNSTVFLETGSPLYLGLLGFILIQLYAVSRREMEELISLVKSFIIPIINLPRITLSYILEVFDSVSSYIERKSNIYLRLSVVRC